jgi:hypothetical protein
MYAVAANDNMIVIVGDNGESEMRPIYEGEEEGWFSTASGIVWVGTAQQSDQSSGD